MRLKMTYIDTSGDDPVTHDLFEGTDFRMNTPILQSSAEYGYSVSVDLNREEDKRFFTSYRGPMKIAFELVETDALVPEEVPVVSAIVGGEAQRLIDLPAQVQGMAWDRDNDRLLILSAGRASGARVPHTIRAYDYTRQRLVNFFPAEATKTYTLSSFVNGMAFLGRVLYAVDRMGGFYRWSDNLGSVSRLGALSGYTGTPNALASVGDTLYMVASNVLYTVNVSTRAVTRITPSGQSIGQDFHALCQHKGILYTVDWSPRTQAYLYILNATTGQLVRRVGTEAYPIDRQSGPTALVGVESFSEDENGIYASVFRSPTPFYRIP